jgi:hypothetical protein
MRTTSLAAVFGITAPMAMADISVSFVESAPKDRFVIMNNACATGPMQVTIDLRPSAGALIFDVASAGAGVEVFQPFELVSGGSLVTNVPNVRDGDQVLTLDLKGLGKDSEVSFTIDLDDTIQAREITVAGTEVLGAKVLLQYDEMQSEGTFDETANMTIPWRDCSS